jgi:hypothetical protein
MTRRATCRLRRSRGCASRCDRENRGRDVHDREQDLQ